MSIPSEPEKYTTSAMIRKHQSIIRTASPGALTGTQSETKWFTLENAAKYANFYKFPVIESMRAENGELSIAVANAFWFSIFHLGYSPPNAPKKLAQPFFSYVISSLNNEAGDMLLTFPNDWKIKANPIPRVYAKAVEDFETVLKDAVGAINAKTEGNGVAELIAKWAIPADFQGRFGEFWKCNWDDKYYTEIGNFMSYFMRLAVKSAIELVALYRTPTHYQGLYQFSGLPETNIFGDIHETYMVPIYDSFQSFLPSLANYMARARCKLKGDEYEMLRKWFGLRWEFFGLANINWLRRIGLKCDIFDALSELATTHTGANFVKIIYSTGLYVECNVNMIAVTQRHAEGPEKMDEDDLKSGCFARMFSPKFLTWLCYARSEEISYRLAGFTLGLERDSLENPPFLLDSQKLTFQRCYILGAWIIDEVEKADEEVGGRMKAILRDQGEGGSRFRHHIPSSAMLEDRTSAKLRSIGANASGILYTTQRASLLSQGKIRNPADRGVTFGNPIQHILGPTPPPQQSVPSGSKPNIPPYVSSAPASTSVPPPIIKTSKFKFPPT